ncbi:hypothetical protein K504DRAFT_305442 [Pleomassaria siparia CBS 279.74]|uniref:Glutamyl-tRNA amidotransferase complex subunit Gta3 domain-containing protein n=1 Tax=Pleomassaria siparia CBS 279.74 TaxID=1314801 RepID=A0A6G1K7D5_9PLEO|nr:hypothetical protein K504DRAFT_305442 [Pleomassaria siparia CBS 279.74]
MISRLVSARARSLLRPTRCSYVLFHTSSSLKAFMGKYGPYGILGHESSIRKVDLAHIEELLEMPTWSVESLLPSSDKALDAPKISSEQLHHLLRLSALPLPETAEEETNMLNTLSTQLHFVGQMQRVDTKDVKPLRAIRDETATAEKDQTVTIATLKAAFDQEEVIGKHHKRIQRNPLPADANDVENWDVLGSTKRKEGKYFVVESERPQE